MLTIALLILLVIGAFVILMYNNLIKLRNKCQEAWADIDTQLTRRYDLIPNIVETVKGYAKHEASTLEKVIEARTKAMNAQTIQEKEEAENMISGALKTIFALAENYPDLKANQNFLNLQQTLTDIEEHLQMSRRYYNGTVRDYNTKLEVFPNNIVAGPLGFKKREFFQATEEEKKNVKVDFSDTQGTPVPPSPTGSNPPPAAASEQPQQTQPQQPAENSQPTTTQAVPPTSETPTSPQAAQPTQETQSATTESPTPAEPEPTDSAIPTKRPDTPTPPENPSEPAAETPKTPETPEQNPEDNKIA